MKKLDEDNVQVISTADRKFVAIGKMVFHINQTWNIPHLHFMVSMVPGKKHEYESICLETEQLSYGKTVEDTIKDMVKATTQCIDHVMKRCKGSSMLDILLEPSLHHSMDGYWRAYRKCEIELAKLEPVPN